MTHVGAHVARRRTARDVQLLRVRTLGPFYWNHRRRRKVGGEGLVLCAFDSRIRDAPHYLLLPVCRASTSISAACLLRNEQLTASEFEGVAGAQTCTPTGVNVMQYPMAAGMSPPPDRSGVWPETALSTFVAQNVVAISEANPCLSLRGTWACSKARHMSHLPSFGSGAPLSMLTLPCSAALELHDFLAGRRLAPPSAQQIASLCASGRFRYSWLLLPCSITAVSGGSPTHHKL